MRVYASGHPKGYNVGSTYGAVAAGANRDADTRDGGVIRIGSFLLSQHDGTLGLRGLTGLRKRYVIELYSYPTPLLRKATLPKHLLDYAPNGHWSSWPHDAVNGQHMALLMLLT